MSTLFDRMAHDLDERVVEYLRTLERYGPDSPRTKHCKDKYAKDENFLRQAISMDISFALSNPSDDGDGVYWGDTD